MTQITTTISTTAHENAGKVIEARAGLPFLQSGTPAQPYEAPLPPAPRQAPIVTGGKGGQHDAQGPYQSDESDMEG